MTAQLTHAGLSGCFHVPAPPSKPLASKQLHDHRKLDTPRVPRDRTLLHGARGLESPQASLSQQAGAALGAAGAGRCWPHTAQRSGTSWEQVCWQEAARKGRDLPAASPSFLPGSAGAGQYGKGHLSSPAFAGWGTCPQGVPAHGDGVEKALSSLEGVWSPGEGGLRHRLPWYGSGTVTASPPFGDTP